MKTIQDLLDNGFAPSVIPAYGNYIKITDNSAIGYNTYKNGEIKQIKKFISEDKKYFEKLEEENSAIIPDGIFGGRWFKNGIMELA